MASNALPELSELEHLLDTGDSSVDVSVACEVSTVATAAVATAAAETRLPVYVIRLGNPSPSVPAIGFFGGIHGLERIGTKVLLEFLHSILMRLRWDHVLHRQLESMRLIFMPLVNPAGMLRGTRANAQGVDLMRNAPLQAPGKVHFLVGGHRISPRLPWYRGAADGPMEAESQSVCRLVENELLTHPFSIALDCHSGFGLRDRIWFPHAHTRTPIAHLAEVDMLETLLRQTYPHHHYLFEPQSVQYLTHGDLWDYLYLQSQADAGRIFLPLTLEMGSWLWLKKNPCQLFSRQGLFNPLPRHRLHRVLRRHLLLFEFLTRAACGYRSWLPHGDLRHQCHERALARWYAS